MKTNGWQRWKHRLRAKGRHGTHSPFVYGFVEEVLRNKSRKHFKIQPISGFSVKEIIRLVLTAGYLKPKHIFSEESLIPVLSNSGYPAGNLTQIEGFPDGVMIVCDKVLSEALWGRLPKKVAIFLFHPDRSPSKKNFLQKIKKKNSSLFILDCYDFMLLVRDPAFKQAQTFLLK